jgi:hypothetical protein
MAWRTQLFLRPLACIAYALRARKLRGIRDSVTVERQEHSLNHEDLEEHEEHEEDEEHEGE